MLSGASWAVLSAAVLFPKWKLKLAVLGTAAAVVFAQALTGGRTGYIGWVVVGLVLCAVRWRKFFPLIPLGIALAIIFVPGLKDRVLQGFGETEGQIVTANDSYEMTSGRNLAWPVVIEQIKKGPVLGFGREGMTTTGLSLFLMEAYNESFPHPHQAYLELLLDSGVIGFLCVIPFYLLVLWHALRLFRDREDRLASVVGGMASALVLALLVGGFGGQTFYPREGAVGMWATIGLMLRFSVERARQPRGLLFTEEEEYDEVVEPEESGGAPTPRWT
jgi:O-antigen ligase